MALTPDVDSYVTLQEADDYFSAHFGYDQWPLQPTEIREQALRSAVMKLDLSCYWDGKKCADDQPLAFPRDEQNCVTPQEVKNAQFEIAYLMISNGAAEVAKENPLSELKAGSVTLKWFDRLPAVDPLESGLVSSLLSRLGSCSSSGTTIIPVQRA